MGRALPPLPVPPAAQAPLTGLTPGRGTLGLLILGRAAFRGLWLAAPILLAGTWSADELGRTLAAIGGFGWVVLLMGGAEKVMLKQVPRLPRLAAQIVRWAFTVTLLPLACALVVAATVTVAGSGASIWWWGLVWAFLGGWLQVLASCHRLERRAWADVVTFAGGGAWVLAVTAATALARWSPVTWVVGCTAGVLAVSMLTALPCRALVRGATRRTAAARPLLRGMVLMGLPDVLSIASLSAGYWALALLGDHADVTPYYVALVSAGVLNAMLGYLLRVHQPEVSLRLRGAGAIRGERLARRLSGWTFLVAVLTIAVALAASGAGLPAPAVLALLAVGQLLTLALRMIAATLVENSRNRWLTGNVVASGVGLAVCCLVLLTLTPTLGAVAGMTGLVSAQAGAAAVMHRMLRPRPVSGSVSARS